jgi:branched-chain amino acid aminotransferase
LFTADAGVLDGLTRQLVLACAEKLGLQVQLVPVTDTELPAIDEAFITSSSRGVLPVAEINGFRTRQPCPGPVTLSLSQAYAEIVSGRLEMI